MLSCLETAEGDLGTRAKRSTMDTFFIIYRLLLAIFSAVIGVVGPSVDLLSVEVAFILLYLILRDGRIER